MDKTIPTDALVTAEDVLQIKTEINRGELKRLVLELTVREPDVMILLSEKFDLVTTLLDGAGLSIKQRAVLMKQVTLLAWMPLLLSDRAHRRSWNDFLPSEPAADESDEEGGAA